MEWVKANWSFLLAVSILVLAVLVVTISGMFGVQQMSMWDKPLSQIKVGESLFVAVILSFLFRRD